MHFLKAYYKGSLLSFIKNHCASRQSTKVFKIPCIAFAHGDNNKRWINPLKLHNTRNNVFCRLTHCFGFFSFGIKNRKFELCSDFGFVARNEKEIQRQVIFALLVQTLRIHSQAPRKQLSHQLTRLTCRSLRRPFLPLSGKPYSSQTFFHFFFHNFFRKLKENNLSRRHTIQQ